jgi:S-adenosylmethionine synthetase
MMVVGHYQGQAVADQAVEIVERKGIGHPDSICDAVAEAVSVALCRAYRECCGRVLHHNIDKGLLVAGRVDLQFGGGRVLQPMELIVGDRATDSWCGREIPVSHIGKIYSVLAQQAARRIQENIAGVREAYVWLLSRIGEPIDRPVMVSAQLVLVRGCELQDVRVRAQELLEEALGGIERLCEQLSQGAVAVC